VYLVPDKVYILLFEKLFPPERVECHGSVCNGGGQVGKDDRPADLVGLQLECVLEQKGELALSEGDVEVSGQVLTKHLDFVKSKKRSIPVITYR
jgi:hypothetical protein